MKTCNKCGESKPVSAFSKDKTRKAGLQHKCKACHNDYFAEYIKANPERLTASKAAYRKANPEKVSASNAAWQKANPEKNAAKEHRRRAHKSSNGVNLVTSAETAAIMAQPCIACSAPGPSELEHLIPIARGGAHTIGNLASLCRSCNASKNDLLYIEWKHSSRPQARKVFAS